MKRVDYSNKEFQTIAYLTKGNHEPSIEIGQGSFTLWYPSIASIRGACSLKPKAPRNFSNALPLLADNMQTRRKPAFNLQGIRSCDRSREQGWREKPSVVRVCRSWEGWLYLCSAISCYLCSAARRNSVSSRANCLSIVNADPETMLYSRRRAIELVSLLDRGGGNLPRFSRKLRPRFSDRRSTPGPKFPSRSHDTWTCTTNKTRRSPPLEKVFLSFSKF